MKVSIRTFAKLCSNHIAEKIEEMEKNDQDTELKAGISEFLNDFEAKTCAYKYRYSDFVVEEIDTDGNILQCDLTAHDCKRNETNHRVQENTRRSEG